MHTSNQKYTCKVKVYDLKNSILHPITMDGYPINYDNPNLINFNNNHILSGILMI